MSETLSRDEVAIWQRRLASQANNRVGRCPSRCRAHLMKTKRCCRLLTQPCTSGRSLATPRIERTPRSSLRMSTRYLASGLPPHAFRRSLSPCSLAKGRSRGSSRWRTRWRPMLRPQPRTRRHTRSTTGRPYLCSKPYLMQSERSWAQPCEWCQRRRTIRVRLDPSLQPAVEFNVRRQLFGVLCPPRCRPPTAHDSSRRSVTLIVRRPCRLTQRPWIAIKHCCAIP